MELQLTSEQEFFLDTTRKFLEDKAPVVALRALRDDPEGFDTGYWRQGSELGWVSLLVSEEDGGGSISGAGLRDLVLVAYEFGRHAAPGPLPAANVVAGTLSRQGTAEQKREVLDGLIAGDVVASWCYSEPRPNNHLGTVSLAATPGPDGFVLNGVKSPVEAGGQAQQFLVTARSDAGLSQFLVPADAPGVTVTPMSSVDLTRRYAQVAFDGVSVARSALVGELGGAQDAVQRQLNISWVLQLAEMVGAMDKALELTIEWAFNRYSFGRPLASYQELKHRFADMKMWLEASHAISDAAAQAVQDDAPDAGIKVSAGKAYVGQYGPELMHDCVQMHGGIGVTFDHDLHLYLRRVVLGAQLLGSVHEHRERLTQILLEGKEAAA